MTEKVIRINQIKLNPNHSTKDLEKCIINILKKVFGINLNSCEYKIIKKSVDSRKKPDIFFIYSVEILMSYFNEIKVSQKMLADKLKKCRGQLAKDINITERYTYEFPTGLSNYNKKINLREEERPVIIGFGPAGMFAALKLSEAGYRPVVYERGETVEKRQTSVNNFWNGGELDENSNVQFGEGGAGTFSDGKLNTMIKDNTGRIKEVLKTFVRFGADPEIMYLNKPHIGTDVLAVIVKNIREHILSLGGEIYFNKMLTGIEYENNNVTDILIKDTKSGEIITRRCKNVCICVGHSARDTFEMIFGLPVVMQPKSFAVGLRIEHPQDFINYNAYGDTSYKMPAADYKVTYTTASGRGVYSFCMCPGGYVVNASSQKGYLAVNGMSYSGRDSRNANSAIIVTVTPDDFGANVLDGINFQRNLEKAAYNAGNGNIPIQLYDDFKNKRISDGLGKVIPCIKGKTSFADLNTVLGKDLSSSIVEGIEGFAGKIADFNMGEAVLSGVESRTSSPLRIVRDETMQSSLKGFFPCGEGAGYAGGITSAAVDGIKAAERIALKIDDIYFKI